MKRCENCIINRLADDDFQCRKDLSAPECIGILQGFVEDLSDQLQKYTYQLASDANNLKVDYVINGEGIVYLSGNATDDEIAAAILRDCSEQDISVEYL